MLKEILERYLNNVAPRVEMKEEKEIAENYLGYLKSVEESNLEKAN